MKFLRKLLLIVFDIIDEYFHQIRIKKFIIKNKIKLDTFIDVGAFKGKYTDLILNINKECKIIMFEPQNKYYSLLKEKFKDNKNIEIIKIGLSDKKAFLNLQINKHEITSTFSKFNDLNKYLNYKAILFGSNLKNMTTNLENVEVLTLDKIFEEKKIKNLDLIKIDTEGHEYEVICGTQNFIKNINYILVEFHLDEIYENYNSDKIHELLVKKGFVLKKTFNFPFTTWEDRLYKNSEIKN